MQHLNLRSLITISLCVIISVSSPLTYFDKTCLQSKPSVAVNQVTASILKSAINSFKNVTNNLGDLIVDGDKSYIIKDCQFNQVGNVIVKENATLVIHNSIFNQTGANRVEIMLYDQACLILNFSKLIFSQYSDSYSYIYVYDRSRLNATNTDMINPEFGIYIWAEDCGVVCLKNSRMIAGSFGGTRRTCVVMAMNYAMVDFHNVSFDRAVCWNEATIFAQDCIIRESVKIFNNAKAYVSKSTVDYVWASQNSTIQFDSSIINSSNPLEYALRAIHHSKVWFKNSKVFGELRAVDKAKIWLVNTSVKNISVRDEASVFVGWELPFFGELYVPYTLAPLIRSITIIAVIASSLLIAVLAVRKIISKHRLSMTKQQIIYFLVNMVFLNIIR